MPGSYFYIGAVSIFTGYFAPRDWMECNGAILPITQNEALFSVIGPLYGGDGVTTFALPNLSARIPLGYDNRQYPLGRQGGSISKRIPSSSMPPHTHTVTVSDSPATETCGENMVLAQANATEVYAPYIPDDTTPLSSESIKENTGGQAFNHLPPSLTVKYCICVRGMYPQRS
jgi:microcystin-dependent protein